MYKELTITAIDNALNNITEKQTDRIVIMAQTVELNGLKQDILTSTIDDVFSFVQEKVAQLTGIAMTMDTKASYARFSAVNSVFEAIQNI